MSNTIQLEKGVFLGKLRGGVEQNGLKISVTSYSPDQLQPWHIHTRPTMFLQLLGQHRDHTPDGEQEQTPFSLNCHPEWMRHRSEVGPGGMSGINIEFDHEWLENHELEPSCFCSHGIDSSPHLGYFGVQLLLKACNGKADAALDAVVLDLISGFLPQYSVSSINPPWLRKAREHLHENFNQRISLQTVAREAGVHPVHLARVFRRSVGCSVADYLHRLRLGHAARQMLVTGATAGEAAAEVGFADQFYMSRLFFRQLACRPSQISTLRDQLISA